MEFHHPPRRLPDVRQIQHHVLEFMLGTELFGCIAAGRSLWPAELVFYLRALVEGDKLLSIASDHHQRLIDCDPSQPGGKFAASAKAVNILEYLQERLLHHVFSIFTVVSDPHGHVEQPASILLHQVIKCCRGSCFKGLYQSCVGICGGLETRNAIQLWWCARRVGLFNYLLQHNFSPRRSVVQRAYQTKPPREGSADSTRRSLLSPAGTAAYVAKVFREHFIVSQMIMESSCQSAHK